MFCYAIFHNNTQLRVFSYSTHGHDWKRACYLAVNLAERLEAAGVPCTVEHFGASGVGTVLPIAAGKIICQ